MDIGRRSYKTTWRPFRDSEEEAEIYWYPALPDAPVLGFPSGVQSLDYVTHPWVASGQGEVWNTDRNYVKYELNPDAKGEHYCGTEQDHAEGSVYDPDLDVQYLSTKLPVCCTPELREQSGGLVINGTARVAYSGTHVQTGGFVLDGKAKVAFSDLRTQTGGLVVNGTAEVAYSGTHEQTGGLVVNGTAEVTYIRTFLQGGGLVLNGTAEVEYIQGPDVGCESYVWDTESEPEEFVYRTDRGEWQNERSILTVDGAGNWHLTDTTTGREWQYLGWDGQDARQFTPLGPWQSALVYCADA